MDAVKNVLIIGGSYFLGKCFLEKLLTKGDEYQVYVLNRGTQPLFQSGEAECRHMQHLIADRHDEAALQKLAGTCFAEQKIDAVVDFCGYSRGDIELIFRTFGGDTPERGSRIGQYIFISTVDVYRRGTGRLLDEEAPYEERDFGGEVGSYITGKVALERELIACSEQYGTAWTILRPAVIYGPGNYAPRETMYFHWIREAAQIIHPTGATGFFQLVYVEDVAEVILAALGNEMALDCAYNVCESKTLTYDDFADILTTATGVNFTKVELAATEVAERGIPLPFPLLREESEHYAGERILPLGIRFTDVIEGLRRTYNYYSKNQE